MTKLAKRRRRPDARPDEILDAALSVFSAKGFAAARVEDIAREAGLSKGAVYLYFPSKEAMLNGLVEQSAGQLARAAEQLVALGAPQDPEAAFRSLLRMLFTAMGDPDINAAPRLVFSEAGRFPDLAAFYRSHVLDIARRALRALLASGVEAGVFRDVDADAFMRTTAGPGIAHMALTTIFAFEADRLTDPVAMADAIADILLNGLKPRPPPKEPPPREPSPHDPLRQTACARACRRRCTRGLLCARNADPSWLCRGRLHPRRAGTAGPGPGSIGARRRAREPRCRAAASG
ncbi:TetR/AcrR family transcriptional regulator [Maricaulis maris]|uniref:TetR/AcrR family transcriptional regulator n=1 Tax=Maricaulis maris TaxID=74318 RepID=UPI0030C6A1E8